MHFEIVVDDCRCVFCGAHLRRAYGGVRDYDADPPTVREGVECLQVALEDDIDTELAANGHKFDEEGVGVLQRLMRMRGHVTVVEKILEIMD